MEGGLLSSPVPGVNLALSLCGEEGIRFGNQHFVPDSTKGYFQFQFSHAFPVMTVYQTGLYPAVIAKSYQSLLHQNLNREHRIAEYNRGEDVRDQVIGGIVAVDYPGQTQINFGADNAPGISGVAVVFKQTQGMVKLLGEHVSGRHRHTVSMEVFYPLLPGDDPANKQNASGFAIELNSKDPQFNFTPPDLLRAGYEYVPADRAPEELVATFSRKKNRVVTRYRGRKVCVLMGGLDHAVHYAGAGVVRYGAEPPAKILRLAASAGHPLDQLAEHLLTAFATQQPQK